MAEDIKNDRSPRSPAIALEDAIGQAATLHRAIGKAKVPLSSVASALGYKSVNGAALTSIGTLNQYQLIQRGDNKVSVSPLALKILYPEGEESKLQAIREAALAPKIFGTIRAEYHDCSADVLSNQLIHQGFTPERARKVAAVYKANSEFAKLSDTSYIPETDEANNRPDKLKQVAPPQDDQSKPVRTQPPVPPVTPGLKDFVFPLSSGTAQIRIPFPIDAEDFDFLLETLNLWKKKLVKP